MHGLVKESAIRPADSAMNRFKARVNFLKSSKIGTFLSLIQSVPYISNLDLSLCTSHIMSKMERLRKSTASPLLSLPAELRNTIWSHVLKGNTFNIKCSVRIPWGVTVSNTTISPHSLALLQTCRQIHAETRLLPFTLNIFQFKSEDAFKPWLANFDRAQQAAIQHVMLVTWKAKHMVESRGFAPRRLVDVFPVEKFKGLRRVEVEVKCAGMVREDENWACGGSELEDVDTVEAEGRLRLRLKKEHPRLEIRFEKVAI
ncbi:uncharacterized protein M421DRAFT_417117 [Didymella exigua CBS 183.55]|uniref:Uncharacterized protein n=1 Tax=Didymella exigua CBS 183.55 TaxID=1150837 RepID=A0A6A5RXZ9_9PLEO|nr:uncharacterized protein M421DRAFT_417117 [Didymella exigua CBS 183.55]KAF1932399.1 hypothetical protein M421DRAFT_417117 [Didymella exigua CBS 183.55]